MPGIQNREINNGNSEPGNQYQATTVGSRLLTYMCMYVCMHVCIMYAHGHGHTVTVINEVRMCFTFKFVFTRSHAAVCIHTYINTYILTYLHTYLVEFSRSHAAVHNVVHTYIHTCIQLEMHR
jgi:hypothetical protein